MGLHSFSVDAQLLRELGERLVGRPHIALAELIKNSYDADATQVQLRFEQNQIIVTDNGHGMSEQDFATRWLRIGTPRKARDQLSPRLHRQMTGSKGVGRLAAQLLARKISIESVALADPTDKDSLLHQAISADIDWDDAVSHDDVTAIEVNVQVQDHPIEPPRRSRSGTRIVLSELVEDWDAREFSRLAEEIWSLQPPFEGTRNKSFSIQLTSDQNDVIAAFEDRMQAILEIWNARITGRLLPAGKVPRIPAQRLPPTMPDPEDDPTDATPVERLHTYGDRYLVATIELRDGATQEVAWLVPACLVDQVTFDIRIFDLIHRQPKNIKVGDARNYLRRFGGVGIYDNGFRLPYYGADQDWLNIERDHAARLGASKLVPKELRIENGLLDLPTNRRVFGVVEVSTGSEAKSAQKAKIADANSLSIQVTRDRLVANAAYHQLQVMVRAGIDTYAMMRARARVVEPPRLDKIEPSQEAFGRLRTTIREVKPNIPEDLYERLDKDLRSAARESRVAEQARRGYSALLGALATAGTTSLAIEHELNRQIEAIAAVSSALREEVDESRPIDPRVIEDSATAIDRWVIRIRSIRRIFDPLVDADANTKQSELKALSVLRDVSHQVAELAAGAHFDFGGVPADLPLRPAPYAAWTSIFQNLFVNAFAALRHESNPVLTVDAVENGSHVTLRVMDNGVGVDLEEAEELWAPFRRSLRLDPEDVEVGYGGTGLGLTIVRMIADELRVQAKFIQPPDGQRTAVALTWRK